jgi:hypothetical protein
MNTTIETRQKANTEFGLSVQREIADWQEKGYTHAAACKSFATLAHSLGVVLPSSIGPPIASHVRNTPPQFQKVE